jgi:hypothetical protein
MGLLYKALVPRPVKRARRTVTRVVNPVRTARRAVTPRAVSVATNPLSYTKGAVENQILRRASGRSRATHRTEARRTTKIALPVNVAGAIALAIFIVDFILSLYAGIKDHSFGEFLGGLMLGLIVLGVFASKI